MNDIFNENVPLKTETPAFAKHVLPAVPLSEVYLEDCVTALKRYADNHFDLAIVDPPYGIGADKGKKGAIPFKGGKPVERAYHPENEWDKARPPVEVLQAIVKAGNVSIIWGGNYFLDRLGNCKCFLIWDKRIAEDMSFAMCEMAWTSFKNGAKIYKTTAMQQNRIHPTQKPVELYDIVIVSSYDATTRQSISSTINDVVWITRNSNRSHTSDNFIILGDFQNIMFWMIIIYIKLRGCGLMIKINVL